MSTIQAVKFDSVEQFNLILRQVRRLYDHKNKTDSRSVRRKQMEYKLLRSLLNKLEPAEAPAQGGKLDLVFNRKEVRAMQSLCLQGIKMLEQFVIPGYTERIEKTQDEKLKVLFEGTKKKAESVLVLYRQLLDQLGK